jgi:hypothetical protein
LSQLSISPSGYDQLCVDVAHRFHQVRSRYG